MICEVREDGNEVVLKSATLGDVIFCKEQHDALQTDCESCEHKHEMGLPCYHCPIAVDCGWGEPNE